MLIFILLFLDVIVISKFDLVLSRHWLLIQSWVNAWLYWWSVWHHWSWWFDDVYSKPQCRRKSFVPGLSLWPMWTTSCIFHNVPTVTMWQLLGRETMQDTLIYLIFSIICSCLSVSLAYVLYVFKKLSLVNLQKLAVIWWLVCLKVSANFPKMSHIFTISLRYSSSSCQKCTDMTLIKKLMLKISLNY